MKIFIASFAIVTISIFIFIWVVFSLKVAFFICSLMGMSWGSGLVTGREQMLALVDEFMANDKS